jgi:hypothetical protein
MARNQKSLQDRPIPHAVNAMTDRPPDEEIARRAYQIFLSRGGVHGRHEQDWAQAERELMARARA